MTDYCCIFCGAGLSRIQGALGVRFCSRRCRTGHRRISIDSRKEKSSSSIRKTVSSIRKTASTIVSACICCGKKLSQLQMLAAVRFCSFKCHKCHRNLTESNNRKERTNCTPKTVFKNSRKKQIGDRRYSIHLGGWVRWMPGHNKARSGWVPESYLALEATGIKLEKRDKVRIADGKAFVY